MIRKYKYTFVSLMFAVLFIFGSMAGMNYILKIRETQLLTESGRAEVESPVREWEGRGDGDEIITSEDMENEDIVNKDKANKDKTNRDKADKDMANEDVGSEDIDGERYALTMEQAAEAVKSWNNRTKITLHDPVAGQISMEEAIETGKRWLAEMGIGKETEVGKEMEVEKEMEMDKEMEMGKEIEMGREIDEVSFSINAELGVGRQNGDIGERLEAYFSFWTVTYSNQSMSAILYLNAVTGKVWGAEITLYEKLPEKFPDESLRLFVELAGLQAADEISVAMSSGETGSVITIKDSQLYAQKQSYSFITGFGNSFDRIIYQLLIAQK